MWLVELMLVSLSGGTVLGVSWYLFDSWREKVQAEAVANAEKTE